MKFLKYLSAFAVAAALAGCSLFPTGPALPENSPRLIAYQLGDEPELLVIPVCDRDGSLAIAAPRILRAPYRDILRLNDECGSVWRRKRQPSRLLMLTQGGTLWSALPVETPEPALVFFRSTLDEAGKAQLLDELKTREFELAAPDSAWLAPGTAELNAPVAVEPLDGDANWDAAVRFVEAAEAPRTGRTVRAVRPRRRTARRLLFGAEIPCQTRLSPERGPDPGVREGQTGPDRQQGRIQRPRGALRGVIHPSGQRKLCIGQAQAFRTRGRIPARTQRHRRPRARARVALRFGPRCRNAGPDHGLVLQPRLSAE